MTIIYPVPEKLPDPRARFIQIMNTCHALARLGVKVKLIAGIKKGYSVREICSFYGISEHPNLEIRGLPMVRKEPSGLLRVSWHGIFHFFLLLRLLFDRAEPGSSQVLYLRHIKLADLVLKFRRIINMPVIFEVHEIFHLTTTDSRKIKRLREIEQRVYRGSDAIVSISESIKKHLIHMDIPEGMIRVIHNGIRKEWIDEIDRSAPDYICYTGSLYAWKGVDTLISAMKFLPGEKLVIVGSGGRLEELKRLSETEGVADRISFAGAVPHAEIPRYLSKAKVAVLPNITDGPSLFSSPLKLFEYLACGIPIVASDIPVFREIITDRENALLCAPNNPEAFAARIREITENPEFARRLSETARKDAENFTYDRRAAHILEVCERLASRR